MVAGVTRRTGTRLGDQLAPGGTAEVAALVEPTGTDRLEAAIGRLPTAGPWHPGQERALGRASSSGPGRATSVAASGKGRDVIEIVVEDEIRSASETVQVHERHTVGVTIRRLVELFDLPWRTVDKRPLTYRLARPGPDDDPDHFTDDQEIAALDLLPGETVVLSSPDASVVWAEINGLLGQVEDELRLQATEWRDEVTGEVRADVSRRLAGIRGEIERVARQRLLGDGARPPLLRRLRARRLMRQVARTGVAPDGVAGVRVGLSQLTTVASMALRAAPFAAGAALVGASAVAVEAADEDLTAEDVKTVVEETLETTTTTTTGAGAGTDPLRVAIREELALALTGRLTAEEVERIVTDAVASIRDDEALRGIIRSEVPAAERDEVTALALGGVERTSPTRALAVGESLWAVAVDARGDPEALGCDPGPFTESTGAYVRRIWAANVGVLGGDPDTIDPADALRIPCPR